MKFSKEYFILLIALALCQHVYCSIEEEEHGVIYANQCEACKVLALELQQRLSETGKSREVIEIGYEQILLVLRVFRMQIIYFDFFF